MLVLILIYKDNCSQILVWVIFVMFNNSKNFTIRLNRVNFDLQARVLKFCVVLVFEVGMWEGIRDLGFFGTSQLQGCLFHFTQCIWCQIQDEGMRQDYINDEWSRLVRF